MSVRALVSTTARTVARTRIAPQITRATRYTPVSALSTRAFTQTQRSFATTTRTMADGNMKCILIKDGKGPAENLYMGEEPVPQPKEGEIQVEIKAFGLNRMDIVQREGRYPLPPQASKTILGVEFSGTVTKVGNNASKYKVGDAVFGLTYGGAYAQYICAHERMCLPKPENLSWVQAAAIPENWLTAYQAVFLEGNMKEGSNVLVHAGASGVGVAAIQLALGVGKATKVYATCGSDEKVKFLNDEIAKGDKRFKAINYRTQNFAEVIKEDNAGVDLVIDFVGKSHFNQNIEALNRDGTVVYLAFLSGPVFDKANFGPVLYKRLTLKGSTLRSRDLEYQSNLLGQFEKNALPQIYDGKMVIAVHEVFPWNEVQKAQKEMQENKNSGKIVFEVTPQ